MNLIAKKNIFFLISAIVIIPGIISLLIWGVRPAIDFTGGTLVEFKFNEVSEESIKNEIESVSNKEGFDLHSIQKSGDMTYLLRLKPITKEENELLKNKFVEKFGDIDEIRYETVGPTVGRETAINAGKSVILASIAIILYIAYAFRNIPKPYSSVHFGICAVAALIHDTILLIGLFSLFGHFFKVELDALFITAMLTVMGFSVHDSIVVFDRIRENLIKWPKKPFDWVVNHSIVQTLARSFSISLTIIFTLSALLLFGGETIRWFVVALIIGTISGTYSSVFNAAPLLVVWQEWDEKKKKKSK